MYWLYALAHQEFSISPTMLWGGTKVKARLNWKNKKCAQKKNKIFEKSYKLRFIKTGFNRIGQKYFEDR